MRKKVFLVFLVTVIVSVGYLAVPKKSPDKKRSEYRIGVVDSLYKIFKLKKRIPVRNDATLYAAKNEYESFQILIYDAERNLDNIKVAASDLVSADGKSEIESSSITIREVGYVPTKKPYYRTPHVGLWPDPLMENEKFSVKRQDAKVLWVTVYVPQDVRAGSYKGLIEIIPEGARIHTIPLHLYVWDFSLPKSFHLKTAFDFYEHFIPRFYTRKKNEHYKAWKERLANITEAYYASMLQYRISPILNLDPLSADFDQRIQGYLERGLTVFGVGRYGGTFGNNWPRDKEGELLSLYRKYAQVLRERNILDKAYLYTWDEGKIGNPRVEEVTRMIHEADPDFKNMVCYHGFWDPEHDAQWGKDIDIWCFQIAHYDEELKKKLERSGKEIWMYVSGPGSTYPNFAIDFVASDARIIPLMCFKFKIKGLLYWAVNFWKVNPYEDAMNT
ncbi:MAG: hypothetical protein JSW40_04545, partial [Candidatus Omnitrophota bacterium]